MTDRDAVPRLYLDANVFIYAVEGNADVADPLRRLFDLFRAGRGIGVTSELTLAEVLPKTSSVQRRTYLNMIVWSRIFDLRPVSRDILIETAEYREHAGMPKLPDAIHVVTAIRAECRTVLSADLRLKLPVGYSVISPAAENLTRLIEEMK
ncbi:MAG: PilT protein-like protein [Bradyrhizobium sp.]|nr:PilT protein-like protein [Bradyrhizobium sp.]